MASSVAANALNSHEVCVALMAQPNMLARDIAALACCNKTAARAARESGWHALLMRTLPHAAGRDAVTALRAYTEATLTKGDEQGAMDCSLGHNTALRIMPEVLPTVSPMSGGEKFTASLFVELAPTDGRGRARVACMFNLLSASRIVDAVDPNPAIVPAYARFSEELEHRIGEWLRISTNAVLANCGGGRVLVFSNKPERFRSNFHDDDGPRNTGHTVRFEVDCSRGSGLAFKRRHDSCFAVLVHVPTDGGAPSVWPQMQAMHTHQGLPSSDNFKLYTLHKWELGQILKTLKWREC